MITVMRTDDAQFPIEITLNGDMKKLTELAAAELYRKLGNAIPDATVWKDVRDELISELLRWRVTTHGCESRNELKIILLKYLLPAPPDTKEG